MMGNNLTATTVRTGQAHPADLRYSTVIQGNVLAAFPQTRQVFLFLHFPAGEGGRTWLSEILPGITTTAQLTQLFCADPAIHQNQPSPQSVLPVCRGIGLTYPGLLKLAPHLEADLEPFVAFRTGAAGRAARLRDQGPSAPEQWLFGHPAHQSVDALLLVATGDPALIPQELAGQHRLAAQHGLSIVFEQEGGTLPGPYAQREHFGFKDGISQPLVRGFDEVGPASSPETGSGSRRAVVASGEFIMGYPRQGQSGGEAPAPPSPAWMHNGAFQVFRRLRQDVSGWREQVTRACQAQPPACRLSEEVLMAKLIGRWQNGVPLAQAAADSSRSSPNQLSDNDFDYEDDPYGYNTPRFAHIRKMYPRINSFIEKEWHRIIRRSVPYGPIIDPQDLENAIPDSDRGLLFNAYMASIEDQFEFLQQGWANDPDFLERGDGPDPLIGTADAPITLRQPAGTKYQICLQRVVHTTGSLYTFVPSLAALRSLADVEGSTRCATSLS